MTVQSPVARQSALPVDPVFPARWSPRAYTDATMTAEQMTVLLEAARWAPSAMNLQPWRMAWALRGETGFDAILSGLVPFNRGWAEKASALVVFASKDEMTGMDGETKTNVWAGFDTGAAWMSLALQAAKVGLYAHGMGGFDPKALAEALNLPAGHTIHAVAAVGYIGAPESLPEGLREREVPSDRLEMAEIAFHGSF
ncbi:nitroreductase family protein [Xinfangfangia sp. CPCC 101601]|uniref:Nitroreductase family protein n=1 Tax=Pseudogemmobacter lacusdianii TaxID=3069608 RepID=A0ABU0VUR0_9RHOB|nr:nitroreductase family protein [Xinfangfangia sp. CPCC 101601]MDQ2065459.1 nitroreductase family protein [Xinfangfangia sp. CPCC 101601]